MANVIRCDRKIEEIYLELCPQKVVEFYEKWAEDGYDKDMAALKFMGPTLAAQEIAFYYPENRASIRVLDVAAGTGQAGTELFKLGFRKIDALDPCQPMLDEARLRRVYRNFHCDLINEQELNIDKGSYDAIITVGGIADGHLPAESIYEMTRLTKPGGIIVLVGNASMWRTLPEYSVKMAAMIKRLEQDGFLSVLREDICENYRFSADRSKTKGVIVTIKRL